MIAPRPPTLGRKGDGRISRDSRGEGSRENAFAVGTTIADRPHTDPYERDYRIRLLPWLCCVKSHVGIWMQGTGSRYPPFEGRSQSVPSRSPPLATMAQCLPPQHAQTVPESPHHPPGH